MELIEEKKVPVPAPAPKSIKLAQKVELGLAGIVLIAGLTLSFIVVWALVIPAGEYLVGAYQRGRVSFGLKPIEIPDISAILDDEPDDKPACQK